MSTTVREALENCQINLDNASRFGISNPMVSIAKSQLDNALQAIENGMGLDDVIQESMFDEVIMTKEKSCKH